jgi:small GTP-binding protein
METAFKVVMLGESGVGKTQLIGQCHYGRFSEQVVRTCGTSFLVHAVHICDCTIQLALWDTAGLAKFDSIRAIYTQGAQAAIICYDMTDSKT